MIFVNRSSYCHAAGVFFAAALTLTWHVVAWAAVPCDTLMSANARGFASIADIQSLHQHWQQTQMGQLVQDESMKPFIEDIRKQLERKLSGVRDKLGVELTDLKDIAGGEIGLGLVERPNERAAVALIVDVTGHEQQLEDLLAKVRKELTKRNASRTNSEVAGTTLTTYTIPPAKEGEIQRTAIFFVKDNMLCASDSPLEIEEMLRRFNGQPGDRLADLDVYLETMGRCQREASGLDPEIRWYVDPFGYARSIRSMATEDRKHLGKDYLKILSSQGFEAIRGIGGYVNLAVGGSYELLHRTSVYAPPVPGAADKYELAMRMMKFPNDEKLVANRWVPRKLASYRTFNLDMTNAFEHFDTLFDAVAGYEDAFDGVLEGLERDPYGPQVKVREDFIAHLGQRVMLITDYEVPITPKCERFMFVIELAGAASEKAIAATVEKFMKADPNASQTQFEGKTIWEIHEAEDDIPDLDIAVADLDLLDPVEEAAPSADDGPVSALSTSAVCVTEGNLFIASHASYLKTIFAPANPGDELSTAGDYREVDAALSRLLGGPVSARCFLRTDEVYRPIYELLRQGKMPEAETLLGRFLNRMLTPADDEDEGILREQKIDGRKLPEFEMVRRYFGPAGTVVRSDEDGWFIVGATLSKMAPQARADNSISAGINTIR
ncbi:MAG: hypothetical protein KDA57_02015 [Planctomycetales bacterium]|nr:hypothetical protein [Planctomycetales bacterium]